MAIELTDAERKTLSILDDSRLSRRARDEVLALTFIRAGLERAAKVCEEEMWQEAMPEDCAAAIRAVLKP